MVEQIQEDQLHLRLVYKGTLLYPNKDFANNKLGRGLSGCTPAMNCSIISGNTIGPVTL